MERMLQHGLDVQLKREEDFWRQKSRVMWLTSSKFNTCFFHASTVIRRCRNNIFCLHREDES